MGNGNSHPRNSNKPNVLEATGRKLPRVSGSVLTNPALKLEVSGPRCHPESARGFCERCEGSAVLRQFNGRSLPTSCVPKSLLIEANQVSRQTRDGANQGDALKVLHERLNLLDIPSICAILSCTDLRFLSLQHGGFCRLFYFLVAFWSAAACWRFFPRPPLRAGCSAWGSSPGELSLGDYPTNASSACRNRGPKAALSTTFCRTLSASDFASSASTVSLKHVFSIHTYVRDWAHCSISRPSWTKNNSKHGWSARSMLPKKSSYSEAGEHSESRSSAGPVSVARVPEY